MKDPQQAIRNAYLSLLENKVFTEGPRYAAVYADFVPSTATRPYVLLSQQTVAEGRTGKRCPSAECTILVEVVWQAQGNIALTSELNTMSAQAIEALEPLAARPTNELEGFEVTEHRLESSNVLDESNGAHVILRRLMRFRDVVFETVTT